jgi:DNA polymerase elongation subunit (family B)
MNSLYGKFGMNPRMTEGVLESASAASTKLNFLRQGASEDFIQITEDLNINFYPIVYNTNLDYYDEKDYNKVLKRALFISLPIAMAVTAYARVELMKYKTAVEGSVLYTDTDSIFTTTPLPDKYIGNNLGQMKLEHVANKAVFIAFLLSCVGVSLHSKLTPNKTSLP